MKRLLASTTAATILLSTTALLQAQPPTVPTFILKFHLSDTANPEVKVLSNDKFDVALTSGGVSWKVQGTDIQGYSGLDLDIDIASEQGDAHSHASSNMHSKVTVKPNGQPVRMGSISTSTNGITQTHYVTVTLQNAN